MKILIRRTALSLLLAICPMVANADPIPPEVEISVIPADQTVVVGDMFAIDIVIAPAGNLVSGFDFLLEFSADILETASVVFGAGFGGGVFPLQQTVGGTDGSLRLAEVSFLLTDPELQALQDSLLDPVSGTFLLATVMFTAEAVGESALEIIGNIAGEDAPFNLVSGPLDPFTFLVDPLGATAQGGRVTVTEPQVSVPEPGSFYLMLVGLGLLALARRRRARAAIG